MKWFLVIILGDWVIVDLDETVVVEEQALGRDHWLQRQIRKLMQTDHLSYEDAKAKLSPLNRTIKKLSHVKLTEDGLVSKRPHYIEIFDDLDENVQNFQTEITTINRLTSKSIKSRAKGFPDD
jgi:hypothetical protein